MSIIKFFNKCIVKIKTILSKSLIIHFFEKSFSKSHSHLQENDKLNIINSSSKELIIVSHPDDETIFCGAHLIKNKCFILCLTNKHDSIRFKDFFTVMNLTKNDFLILDYPDLSNGIVNNWNKYEKSIYSDINTIINLKIWDKIITHNPNGEYGHIHHKKTSKITTKICRKNNLLDKLFYFYYLDSQPINNFREKQKLLDIYKKHQPNAIKFLENTAKYESIIPQEKYKKIKII